MREMSSYINVLNRVCEKVQQNMASKQKDSDNIEWDVNVEILLFYAMIGHKPVGVNRNFMMLCIHQKFSTFLNRQISSKVIWDHLDSMYDMAALHESEDLPFPKDEVDFELPEEFDELISEKYGIERQRPVVEKEQSKNNNAMKVSKKLNTSKLKQNNTTLANSKNTFAVPVANKIGKSYVKNETKSISNESNSKVKLDSALPKPNKVKRSSSPFSSKNSKTEAVTVSKDESDTTSKKLKSERGSSPASSKKPSKIETSNPVISSKKSIKQEQNGVTLKPKLETPDSNSKKIKNEKEVSNKKSKSATLSDNSVKKSTKVENNSSGKKKNEMENSAKRSDSIGSKQKSDVKNSSSTNKGSRTDETDAPAISSSRKSVAAVKADVNDSAKKGKRQRSEDSSKKGTPTAKRRRT